MSNKIYGRPVTTPYNPKKLGSGGGSGTPGQDGKDGVSATHSWNGTVLTITSASGTSSADLKGEKGDKGDTGAKGDNNVFIGDENTTVAEYFEAYQDGKACFMARNRGGSGNWTWMMVNANSSKADFVSIDNNGDIMFGRLLADGTWDYQTNEIPTEVGVTSWNDLEDKPFGEIPGDTLTWDGNTDGMVSFVDEYEDETFYKMSDSLPTEEELEVSVTKAYVNGEIQTYEGEENVVAPNEPNISIVDVDGNDCVIVILESGVRGATEPGVYFRKHTDDSYIQSLTIPGYTGFTTTKKIDSKYLPDNISGGSGTPGKDGEDGFSPVAKVEQTSTGAKITITDKNGTTTATVTNGKDGAKGEKGDTGATGADGKTPVKGTDYFTAADKTEMVNSVLAALPTWNGGAY